MPLAGERVVLRPLAHAALADLAPGLHAAGHPPDPQQALALWQWLPYGPFADTAAFAAWLAGCARSVDPLFFAVERRDDGAAQGMVAFLNSRPGDGVVEIGHIWFAPSLQRTAAATEAIRLLLGHAFDVLGCRRVEWKCDAQNAPSVRAARRLGFVFEGTFYRHMLVKGRNRDTQWFSIIAEEWPAVAAALDAWLAAANFDAAGRQRRSLAAIRGHHP